MEYLIRDFAASCLRARHGEPALPAIRETAKRPDIDWGAVVDFALDEALGPLLFDVLLVAGIAPAGVLQALREKYNYMARRNLLLQ